MRAFKKYFREHEFHLLTLEEFRDIFHQIEKDFSKGLTTWEKVDGYSDLERLFY